MSSITLTKVRKQWGNAPAVDDVSLSVAPGSFVALLGPSGCGKSTTLRLIAGLEACDSGRIDIGGQDVTDLPPARRGVAMVFQSYALFPHLSVAENIVFGLAVRRVPRAEREARLAQAAELLGLSGLLDRKPAQLSGGQRQRIALGRAIVSRAPVCLMDEPLSNLDAQLRQQMRTEIRALQRRLGITMVYVTHDQTEAMTMADHVVLMRNGRVEQQGTPAELYEQPASTFAAAFIGAPAMNLMPSALLANHAGAPSTVGVRPEHIGVCGHDDDLSARLQVHVQSVEYLGAESMLVCAATADASTRVVVRQPGRSACATGDAIDLHWPASHQHHFDPESGRRLITDASLVPSPPSVHSPTLEQLA
ncbi:MAG: ABC transporter ATP-binding protein [Hydrogenophaga sp.]|uniref:ABC transporter ATP-binding protein n=1 Tax=Hydrogenophaga sp. TaxID=1904254 RepID=UPI001E10EAE8|nr:ABC transporter ATP-binding protein [Hydrogenophaga sp.]MBX3609399.1 ABC transporter ATP-binding protein [Hydrogenophaga sp.]